MRQAHGTLAAVLSANTNQIGPEWFQATSETPDEAQAEFERFKWRSGKS